jgi:hypothetical protein
VDSYSSLEIGYVRSESAPDVTKKRKKDTSQVAEKIKTL